MTELIIFILVLWLIIEVILPILLTIGDVFILLIIGIFQWLKNNRLLKPLIFILILAILLGR